MKVILKEDVKGHGKKGQMVNASDGYARNYLFPKGLAVPANNQNINEMNNRNNAIAHKIEEDKKEALALKEVIGSANVKIKAKAGESGRLFGAVTAKDISDELKKQFSIDIDKRKIILPEPIKNFGTYILEVKLYPEIAAKLNVSVSE